MTASAAHETYDYSSRGVAISLQELIALRGKLPKAASLSRSLVQAAYPGLHATLNLSRGMEYAESRHYQPGDDVRAIDWRQTARRGRPYTKLFQEEHERPVQLLVDMGTSMRFGTRTMFKSVAAARAAAWLAWRSADMGDRVGGAVLGVGVQQEVRPQGRRQGTLALLRQLAAASLLRPVAVEITPILRGLRAALRPQTQIVLISDFAMLDASVASEISMLCRHARVTLVHVYDSFEADPPPGRYLLSDGNQRQRLDLTTASARSAFCAAFSARREALEKLAQSSGALLVPLATHDDPAVVLGRVGCHAPAMVRAISI